MRIGIIGSGRIGGTLARLFVRAGHEVRVSNSRGPETLEDLAAELGELGGATSAADAAALGDLLVVSVPFGRYREIPAGETTGKIVIDTNNYYPNRDGQFAELDSDQTTSSELLQTHLPGARVVKAFNGINWERLRDRGQRAGSPDRLGIPISGDDPDAKATVARLIDEIGFDAVDAGTLATGGRKHQPGTAVYGADLLTSDLRGTLETL
jgi:predicted dinucleotide-binding enzyme